MQKKPQVGDVWHTNGWVYEEDLHLPPEQRTTHKKFVVVAAVDGDKCKLVGLRITTNSSPRDEFDVPITVIAEVKGEKKEFRITRTSRAQEINFTELSRDKRYGYVEVKSLTAALSAYLKYIANCK